jgi:hypothetical protein
MRPDMQKVIISRPRTGGSKTPRYKAKSAHLRDIEVFDGGPSKEGMRRRHVAYHGWDGKAQTDLLGPLKRFLHSRVGQDWNSVWSEICRHADARNLIGLHLRLHTCLYVVMAHQGTDGTLYDDQGREIKQRYRRYQQFYVDPTTNQLRQITSKSPHARTTRRAKVFALADRLLHRHDDGNWYRVKMAVWDSRSVVGDCFLKGLSSDPSWTVVRERLVAKYGRNPTGAVWYCIHKEAANRKEIMQVTRKSLSVTLARQ